MGFLCGICLSSHSLFRSVFVFFFFFNDTAPTEIYPLPLHDALPISVDACRLAPGGTFAAGTGNSAPTPCPAGTFNPDAGATTAAGCTAAPAGSFAAGTRDRKSTRLNSSHDQISYAVFCLKKKKKTQH